MRNYVRFTRATTPTLCSCCAQQMHEGVRVYSSALQGSWIICDDCAEAIGGQASDPGAEPATLRAKMQGEYCQ